MVGQKGFTKDELLDELSRYSKRVEELECQVALLSRKEVKFRTLFESADASIFTLKDGLFTECNPATFRMFGCSREQIVGKSPARLSPELQPDGENSEKKAVEKMRLAMDGTAQAFEWVHARCDGTLFYSEVFLNRFEISGDVFLQAIVRDISARKEYERQLAREKECLESLLENNILAIATLDEKHQIVSCNRQFERLFQYAESELIGRDLDDVVAVEELYDEATYFSKKALKGESVYGEGRRYRKDRVLIDVEFFGVPVTFEDQVIGIYAVYMDISKRKKAEKALRESEEKYRALVENAIDAVVVTQDGVIRYANASAASISGYHLDRLLGMKYLEMIHPADRVKLKQRRSQGMDGESVPTLGTFRIKDAQAEDVFLQGNSVIISWNGSPAMLNFLRDVTELKKLELQLFHSQKMEAVGTLAGGVAHDFNNILTGIQGSASLLKLKSDPDDPNRRYLQKIEEYVRTASDLNKQLLGFSRGGKYEVLPADLNFLITVTSDMFGRTRRDVRIRRNLAKDLSTVEADKGQIETALVNLFVNAADSMPEGGDIFIETENALLGAKKGGSLGLKSGDYVRISVRDTGVGMDEKARKRAFDPFYTTRRMKRGAGLGLASVYGIIKNHGGMVDIQSEPGQGTMFEIFLPAGDKKGKKRKMTGKELLKGSETVLLVDDEEMILGIGNDMLKALGYDVLTAGSGEKAIESYTENIGKVDLVILDIRMPGMDGGDTYDRLMEIDPSVKVLLSSGYSLDGEATEILERGCDGFIQKPFDLEALSIKLREILD